MNLVELETIVNDLEVDNFVSPYRAAKVINEAFGIDLPPQMLYNYAKKGYITISLNTTGKKQIAKDDLKAFMVRYGTKNLVEKE